MEPAIILPYSSYTDIAGFLKIFNTRHLLSKLFCELYMYSQHENFLSFNNSCLCSKLRTLSPFLSSLSLQMTSLNESLLKALNKSLPTLKNLQHLNIVFDSNSQKIPESFSKLLESLLHLKKLTSLCVTSNLQGTELVILLASFKMLTNLRTLQLTFWESDEKSLNYLASILPNFKSLAQINLILRGGAGEGKRIEGETVVKIFKSFQTMKSLSDISFKLFKFIVNQSDSEPLAEGLACLDHHLLQKLNLFLNQQNVNNQSLSRISQALSKFASLKIFQLNLLDCTNVTNQGIADLSSVLSTLTSLTSLAILVKFDIAVEFMVRDIASALKSLPNLVNLRLDFSSYKRNTHDQVQQLFLGLKNLARLRFIQIDLSDQKSLSDATLEILGNSLKELTLLKSLSFNFNGTDFFTTQGVEALCYGVKDLQNLSYLTLNLRYNKEIDEKAVEKIVEMLQSRSTLKKMTFNFDRYPKLKTSTV